MVTRFHQHYLTLVEEIERRFPVAEWKGADVEIWPLARMDLYLDMYWQSVGGRPSDSVPRPVRALAHATRPLTNVWKRRHDMRHFLGWPRPAPAIFLGDGVSLDCIEGAWQDRYCEPLIAALESKGLHTVLMQSGDMRRQPWHRPTFAANVVEAAGQALALLFRNHVELSGHEELRQFLRKDGIEAPSLSATKLARRASVVSATAYAFEQILKAVRPRMAFVVTYYADLGPAFVLACRRQGILSIDLQHCPQAGRHKAYRWSAVPAKGYATLPAVFWNWTEEDAAFIDSWAHKLPLPWHRSVHGGHPTLAAFLDDEDPRTRHWDDMFRKTGDGGKFDREILVALQTVDGQREKWNALADQIDAAPPGWRWWIRRHPASRVEHDAYFAGLLSRHRSNVLIEEATLLPLPALLRHMSVVVSLASGTAAEASAFGVPALFLSDEARGLFGNLIDSGSATVVDDIRNLNALIARLPGTPSRPQGVRQPDLSQTLAKLSDMANDYARLCAKHEMTT